MYALFTGIALMLILLITPANVFANETSIPISIKPVLPENQDSNISSYISINSKSKALKQDLEFTIINNTNVEQEVEMKIVDAYTSPNGIVQYTDKEQENSKIIDNNYKISSYLKLNEINKIKLSGKEERKIKASLDVDNLEGTLLGGIAFKTTTDSENVEEGKNTFQINNEINMIVGIMIDFETDQETNLLIDEPFVDPMPSYYVIRLPITLNSPLFKKVNFDYEVHQASDILFSNNNELDFAPQTRTNIALPWEHEEIEREVTYLLKGELTYKDQSGKKQTKKIEKEFMFKRDKNEVTVFDTLKAPLEKNGFSMYWLLMFVIVIGLVYFYIRKKKYNKNYYNNEVK